MPENSELLADFDHELSVTRKTLERIPSDKFSWSPHPKSNSMGHLAAHLANLPVWVVITLAQDSLDLEAPSPERELPHSTDTLLALFDHNAGEARAALETAEEAHLRQIWTLHAGDKTLVALPRTAVIRQFVIHHMIHHRAQLGVYLRLNDIAVPAVYGPSADEGSF